jgi:hypothetical protein|nr:MAG TPA: hemolysin [Caudoviricetes sp.]
MTDLDIERITKIEERGKSNTHRIEELEQVTKAIYEQNITIAKLVKTMENNNEILKDHSDRLKAIEKKASDRMSQIISVIIAAIASGIIGYFVSTILK